MSEFDDDEVERKEEDKRKRAPSRSSGSLVLQRMRDHSPELEEFVCKRIAEFRLDDHAFAAGACGFVVSAVYKGVPVAIKIENRERLEFEREFLVANIASDKGFGPRVFGGKFCTERKRSFSFIVMEKCERVPAGFNTLDSLGQRLPVIKRMHQAGVEHGDLHRGNWLLRDGELVICDFGSSKLYTDMDISLTRMAADDIEYLAADLAEGSREQYAEFLDPRTSDQP